MQPVALVAADSTLLYVNPAGAHAVGQDPGSLTGRRMLDLVHPGDRARVGDQLRKLATGRPSAGIASYRIRATSSAAWRLFESTANNLLDDPAVGGILVSSRDITEAALRDRQLRDAACTDPLTGLANRQTFSDALASMPPGVRHGVLYVGVDHFSRLNESLGHEAASAALHAIGARIAAANPSAACVARVSGETFAVLLRAEDDAVLTSAGWHVLGRIAEPLWIGGHELQLTASAGSSHEGLSSARELLLEDAALAFGRARRLGGGTVESFRPALREAAATRRLLELHLTRALRRADLRLAVQPIVRLSDEQVVGGEALLRWTHLGRPVPPDEFIPIAEESALIVELGTWVLENALSLVDPALGRINVNVSARQLSSPGLVRDITRAIRTSGLPPEALGLEVTESFLVERFDYAADVLRSLRDLGCRVGLDDFGTGYSSLGYLRRLPLDFLKIDASLTADVATDARARAVLKAITTMAVALGLDTVAEGLENREQVDVLTEMGVAYGQGYLFGRPTTASRPA